jgi:A/G-specific adenine glycosylase
MHSPHSLRLALSSLLPWFRSHGKTYPWQVRDPYAVWISEIMLQQTTVSSVVPRYIAWMNQYPSVRELAQASIEEVLRAWEGLGYYSRAKNIHKAARELQKDGFESPPDNKKYLRSLPGIGEYTAAAILSFAYQEPEGVYDANVRRLFARLSADENPGAQRPWRRAYAAFLHEGKPGEINAALMQFGQLVCRSREPSCSLCPLRNYCRAFQEGRVGDFPGQKK